MTKVHSERTTDRANTETEITTRDLGRRTIWISVSPFSLPPTPAPGSLEDTRRYLGEGLGLLDSSSLRRWIEQRRPAGGKQSRRGRSPGALSDQRGHRNDHPPPPLHKLQFSSRSESPEIPSAIHRCAGISGNMILVPRPFYFVSLLYSFNWVDYERHEKREI